MSVRFEELRKGDRFRELGSTVVYEVISTPVVAAPPRTDLVTFLARDVRDVDTATATFQRVRWSPVLYIEPQMLCDCGVC